MKVINSEIYGPVWESQVLPLVEVQSLHLATH